MTTKLYVNDSNNNPIPELHAWAESKFVAPADPENDDDLQQGFESTWDNIDQFRGELAQHFNVARILIEDDTIDMGDWMFVIFDADNTDVPLAFINWDVFGDIDH